ncbi:DNA-binding transcriptional MocR family regulator [Bradyrhizobium sp. USDA 4350]
MRKIPTNSRKPAARKPELPLDLTGPHVTPGAASQQRLYQALCHTIVGGLVKPGEPLPPSRALARQTGFRRNAVTTAYERLIADGFAVATTGSGTFVAARIPAQATAPRRAKIEIEPPQHNALSLGCTHIDERALQRFRAFAGRRLRAFGSEHLHYGDPRGSSELRAAISDHLLSARGLRCDPDQIMLASGTLHALRIVLGAILKPGDQVWCEDPGYPAARRAIEHCGYRPVSVPVDGSGMRIDRGRVSAPVARAPPMSRRRTSFRSAYRWRCRAGSSCSTGPGTPAPSCSRTITTASSAMTALRCCRSPASIICAA